MGCPSGGFQAPSVEVVVLPPRDDPNRDRRGRDRPRPWLGGRGHASITDPQEVAGAKGPALDPAESSLEVGGAAGEQVTR